MAIPTGKSRIPKGSIEPICAIPVGIVERRQKPDGRNPDARPFAPKKEWAAVASYSNKDRGAADRQQAESVIYAQASVRTAERHRAGVRIRDCEAVVYRPFPRTRRSTGSTSSAIRWTRQPVISSTKETSPTWTKAAFSFRGTRRRFQSSRVRISPGLPAYNTRATSRRSW